MDNLKLIKDIICSKRLDGFENLETFKCKNKLDDNKWSILNRNYGFG